jgi:hypothetical protein
MALENKILDGIANLNFNTSHSSFQGFKKRNCHLDTRSLNSFKPKMVALYWWLFGVNWSYCSLYKTYVSLFGCLEKMQLVHE